MKRILPTALAVCMLLPAASAGAEPVDTNTIEMTVSINTPDLEGVHLSFNYDEAKIAFVSEKPYKGHTAIVSDSGSTEWSVMLDPEGEALVYGDPLVTFTFYADSTVDINELPLTITVTEAYDSALKDIDLDGCTRVEIASKKEAGTYGNVNGDGSVDASDALAILRASVGIEKLGSSEIAAADINGDGSVDSTDALGVLQYTVEIQNEANSNVSKPVYETANRTAALSELKP